MTASPVPPRPFRVLGLQQIAIGGVDKQRLRGLWVDLLGLSVTGTFRSERENVDEDICALGAGAHAIEVDLMQPLDPDRKPAVHTTPLNHVGLWVDDLPRAVEWLQAQGVRFTPGGIRRGAAGHDICFIHPKGDAALPLGGEGVLIELVQAPAEVIAASRRSATGGTAPELPPHSPLRDYYADEAEHVAYLRRMFDDTAPDYDRIERVLALGTGARYRRQALQRAGLRSGDRVLDVGTGTGLVAREALQVIGPAGQLVGVDPSPGMLAQARLPGVELVVGRAESLPRPDASCNFLSLGYALRHLSDLGAAFKEFHRVLAPGGRLLLLEISRPEGRLARGVLKAYMRALVPLAARLVARRGRTPELWRYYWDTIDACVAPEVILQALREAGFTDVRRHVEVGVFSEYTAQRGSA